ncbi:MAG: hypothetical protein AAF141_02815 [Pseudomonadota bacterium]
MKNKISDLNDHLFAQLERLSDEDLTVEQIEQEVSRSKAIVSVSNQIVEGARLQIKAAELYTEHGAYIERRLPQLAVKTIEGSSS